MNGVGHLSVSSTDDVVHPRFQGDEAGIGIGHGDNLKELVVLIEFAVVAMGCLLIDLL